MNPTRRRRTRSGFTLVELVTAASLMTVMMLGVVEVFAIITQTASEAEGIHFAQQQMRALFNRLHDDFRGMTREGYLQIKKGSIVKQSDDYVYQSQAVDQQTEPKSCYAADTLAFVSVGAHRDQIDYNESDFRSHGGSAEVVYTNYVQTDGNSVPSRIRRGILGRGAWIMSGAPGAGTDPSGVSQYADLSDLFADLNTATGMGGKDRLSSSFGQDGHLGVKPWTPDRSSTSSLPLETLNRVMACCVSEFYVEVFDPEAVAASTGGSSAANVFRQPPETKYRWSSHFDVNDRPKTWPRAIRVTVAVHDPDETSPKPPTEARFRGFAMQEVFWFGDP